ncbi:protein phosphatase 1F [Gadus chalcogrammus]|uniref:protein phosphatase 1F n=1 Tax=Gadus chalcogrammus TaxID=1042646 RepID=UPI0024C4DE48|nr:protein phosphatase 1F [Gadus chalcogrammus]
MAEPDVRSFLRRLGEDFPSALGPEDPLPLRPLSRGAVGLEELQGESLELGLRLLGTWSTPPALSALLCQAAVAKVLQSDLSPFHCPPQTLANQEQEVDQDPVQLLQSEPFQRFFLNTLREVGVAWHRTPPTPPPSPTSFVPLCSVHAIRNARRKMEDRHVALEHFSTLFNLQDGVQRRYYGVFDGHGGVDAAVFAAAHLQVLLSQEAELRSDAAAAFRHAFLLTDQMFRDKAGRERLRSGSTGVAVLIQDQDLTLAWLGDSQALLVTQGHVVPLMEPHKPEREDERRRVEELGGCVTFSGCWRVNGTYAVSRAIGDFDQKPYVSGEADSVTVSLSGGEDFLLLACDGFFDTVSAAEVPGLVLDALEGGAGVAGGGAGVAGEGGGVAAAGEGVAQKLVSHAREAGSSDNITVMVVFLRPPHSVLASGRVATATAQPAPDRSEDSDTQDASG